MATWFVTSTKGFRTQEEAEDYARIESGKTHAKYAVLVRSIDLGPSLSTIAIYHEGRKSLRAEYLPGE